MPSESLDFEDDALITVSFQGVEHVFSQGTISMLRAAVSSAH